MKSQKLISSMMLLFFLYFLYLTFPFGPSTSVLPFGQAQAELRDIIVIR